MQGKVLTKSSLGPAKQPASEDWEKEAFLPTSPPSPPQTTPNGPWVAPPLTGPVAPKYLFCSTRTHTRGIAGSAEENQRYQGHHTGMEDHLVTMEFT